MGEKRMKLAIQQIEQSFALLSNENVSVRQLAKRLKVDKSTLIYRLRQRYGHDYIARSKGLDGSLLKVIRQDIQPSLKSSDRLEFRAWLSRNTEVLAAPANLYTDTQLDRLSQNETHKVEDYRSLLDRWTPDTQYETIKVSPTAFVAAPPAPKSIKSSYVQQGDLFEVLTQFYEGQLDNCDHYLDRLYMGADQLHPSNSLWARLDSQDVQTALSRLSEESATLLEYHFTRTDAALERVHHYYFQSQHPTLNDYLIQQTPEALNQISEQILKVL